MESAALQALADRQAIVDTIVRWASALDAKDWALERLTTHHMSTNHLVTLDGDRATCVSAMLIHRLDPARERDNTFDTLAHYTHVLVRTPRGWRISRVRQAVAWNRGNAAIHAGAAGAR